MTLHVELTMQMRLPFFTFASIGLHCSLTVFFHGSNDSCSDKSAVNFYLRQMPTQ